MNVVFTPTTGGNRTGQLSILTNVVANPYVAPLTGVGVVPGFTLTDSAGKSTTTVSVAAGSTGTASLVYTPVGGFNACDLDDVCRTGYGASGCDLHGSGDVHALRYGSGDADGFLRDDFAREDQWYCAAISLVHRGRPRFC